jgi:hypothetical protein
MPDPVKVEQLLMSMPDLAGDPATLAKQFAEGAAPAPDKLKRYEQFEYQLEAAPRLTGAGCTARVIVTKAGSDEQVGIVEWSLVKDGEAWKLQSAPLP